MTKRFWILAALLALLMVVVIAAPIIAPYDPLATDYGAALTGPTAAHPLGLDNFGRDIASRIIYGARTTVLMTLGATFATLVIGSVIGCVAGLRGGWLDSVLMRLSDTFMAFPELVLGIAIVGAMGPSLLNASIAIAAVMWVRFARVARGLTVALRESDFLFTARMSGTRWPRLCAHYLLPAIMPQMAATALLEIGNIMLTLAAFSFLGLGVQPPTPEWGAMLNDGRAYFQKAPYLMIFPGLAVFGTVVLFNLFGNAVMERISSPESVA